MNTSNKNVSRRNFVRITGISGAALTVGLYLPASAKNKAKIITGEDAVNLSIEMNAWVSIDKAGKVTLMNHRSEMGQGAYQVVPQMIAEELEVNLNDVNIQFAPGNNKKYGSQITGGSSTVRGSYKNLLRMGATAREMLIATAAKKWNVSNTECYAENAAVIHKPTGKKFGYGELAEEAAKSEAPKNVQLKKREAYKIIGKPLHRQDTPSKVNGKAIFGIDKKLEGMMYAVVERCPRIVGKVKSFDDSAAKAVPGVKHVFKIQRGVFDSLLEGVAVVADNVWSAMQGRKALKVEWDDDGFEHLSTAQLYERMKADLSKDHLNDRSAGNFQMVFDKATKKVEAVYETPYESHSCMEPLNCVAHVHDNKCEIWGPIQGPDWIQADISTHLGIPIENVTVNMTFLGGGFGRKAFTDYPHEAVVISKEIKAPVQVVWTREDDMTQGPFRPGAVYGCKGAINGGRIAAMQTKMATQNMDQQGPNADKSKYNSSTIEGLLKPYLDVIPDYSFGDVPTASPIPVMWWRSVYASTNGFAYESFIDELAIAAEKDPLAFRRAHLESNPRYAVLVDKLSEVTNWETRGKNEGWGVAITECFDSIVGEVVKVSKKPSGGVKIDKVIAVMDCGWYVNPDIIKAQVEGSIMMALGAATVHETTFEDGKAVEKNFDRYRMPRFTDAPEIEVHIMDNDEKAGGVGEPGLPPFSPALTNAIFDLTGKRIRKLPFSLDEV
ncbi:xanthine dehydrogenase family protein molybdopterin-binding subunit [Panacibacter ginsenosidivorans]|uniref:Xanthine dehydrogenase family protein molybdopterin-binding subunit n=1 Tax=Panacibacter ginsenosidivorans TaxID=1813871 RepID=A0A5B8V983_9BACT|nr:xanthine dehydrogenase family protein molybdopterin-binding subunit [Panacibacter ginsenosidivorans]QEC67483.1 xanthine dehydrogenase family protein molybdopterin-binding subunit [Panacibacter ginsenosidivorans]